MSRVSESSEIHPATSGLSARVVIPELLRKGRDERALRRFEGFSPTRASILLIEPQVDRQVAIGELLRSVGLRPILVSTATEALETMVRRFVDVVVCSHALPDMSGCELARELKALRCVPAHLPIPVILLASSSDSSAHEALRSGADLVCLMDRAVTMLIPQVLFLLR